MTPEDVLQLIRTCNLYQVIAQLRLEQQKNPAKYDLITAFYRDAAKRKKSP